MGFPQQSSGRGSPELRLSDSEREDEGKKDDAAYESFCFEDSNNCPKRPRTHMHMHMHMRTSYRIALVGILAIVVALRFLGQSENNHNGNDVGWDDETHRAWEVYLVGNKNKHEHEYHANPRYNDAYAGLGAAGSLLGSASQTTETETQSEAESAKAKAMATTTMTLATISTAVGGDFLYFNQSSAFARLNPLEADFFYYQEGWEAQVTQALCAVATTAAMLNSLRDVGPGFELPMDPVYEPFLWATQHNLLASAATNDCVREALGGNLANAEAVYHLGLGLAMVPRLANCFLAKNGYTATGHPAGPFHATERDDDDDDDNDDEATDASSEMKDRVVAALKDPSSRVLYNYDRGGMGQGPLGHGHWSPLGGYHEATDSFLVMDVAKYKHPMVWASWDDLWSGASTVDGCGEALSLPDTLVWSAPFDKILGMIGPRCIPGHRGFVVVEPVEHI